MKKYIIILILFSNSIFGQTLREKITTNLGDNSGISALRMRTTLNYISDSLTLKVDKISGKGLSANDFTNVYKTALDGLSTTLATKASVTSVETNTTAIVTNTANIVTNTTAIATNTANIVTNTTAIASNTANIVTNTTAIATKASITLANLKLHTVFSKTDLQAFTDANIAQYDGSTWERKTSTVNVPSNGGIYAGTIINVSNTSYWKRKTDFITPEMFGAVGDGTTDDITAFRNCYLVGGRISWGAGQSYSISGAVEVFSNTSTNGNGATVTQTSTLTGCFYATSKTNIIFDNIRIQGKGTDYLNTSSGASANGIFFNGCTYFSVKNSKIKNVSGACIYINLTSNNFTIENNELEGSLRGVAQNISLQYGMGVFLNSNAIDNFIIRNNEILWSAQGIVGGGNVVNFTITGNKIHDVVGQHGIYVDNCINGNISDNIIYNINSNGIKIQIANGITTDIDNIIIAKNNIKNAKNAIVTTKADASNLTTVFKNIQITDNVIDSQTLTSSNSIQCEVLKNSIIANNVITNSKNGIYCFSSNNVKISNNLIAESGDNGIRVYNSESMQLAYNSVRNPGLNGNSTEASGVYIFGSLTKKGYLLGNVFLDDNTTNKMEYGVFVNGLEYTSLTLKDNKATGFTIAGYKLNNAGSFLELFQNNVGTIVNVPTYYKIAENEFEGTGTPLNVVTAKIGSRYYRLDGSTGTSFYIKESAGTASTGWVAK